MCQLVSPTLSTRPDVQTMAADLRNVVKRITIYENLLRPMLSGEIEFTDNAALTTVVPLLGVERLRLAFRVYDSKTGAYRHYGTVAAPLVFSLFAQQNRRPLNQASESYVLSMVSTEMYSSTELQISRAFHNVRVEDAIRDILVAGMGSTKPFVDIEPTTKPIFITMPYMTPLNAIKMLMLYGQNATHGSSYMFYETLDGFHFKSLREMIRVGSTRSIPTIRQQLAGTTHIRQSSDLMYADTMELVSGYDMLYLLSQGYFASMTYKVDVLSGQYQIDPTRASDPTFQQRPRVNGESSIDVYPPELAEAAHLSSRIFVVPTTELSMRDASLTGADPSLRDSVIASTLASRNRELLSLQTRTIRVLVSGAPELHVGTLVNVVFPTPITNSVTGRGVRDAASGRYLIVAAQHTIASAGSGQFLYETLFEAGTDSLSEAGS